MRVIMFVVLFLMISSCKSTSTANNSSAKSEVGATSSMSSIDHILTQFTAKINSNNSNLVKILGQDDSIWNPIKEEAVSLNKQFKNNPGARLTDEQVKKFNPLRNYGISFCDSLLSSETDIYRSNFIEVLKQEREQISREVNVGMAVEDAYSILNKVILLIRSTGQFTGSSATVAARNDISDGQVLITKTRAFQKTIADHDSGTQIDAAYEDINQHLKNKYNGGKSLPALVVTLKREIDKLYDSRN